MRGLVALGAGRGIVLGQVNIRTYLGSTLHRSIIDMHIVSLFLLSP